MTLTLSFQICLCLPLSPLKREPNRAHYIPDTQWSVNYLVLSNNLLKSLHISLGLARGLHLFPSRVMTSIYHA